MNRLANIGVRTSIASSILLSLPLLTSPSLFVGNNINGAHFKLKYKWDPHVIYDGFEY